MILKIKRDAALEGGFRGAVKQTGRGQRTDSRQLLNLVHFQYHIGARYLLMALLWLLLLLRLLLRLHGCVRDEAPKWNGRCREAHAAGERTLDS